MPILGGSAMEFETKKQRNNYFRSVNTIINDGPAARPEWAKVPITFTKEDFKLKSVIHNDAMVIVGKAKKKNISVRAPPGKHHQKQQEHAELQQPQLSSQPSSTSFDSFGRGWRPPEVQHLKLVRKICACISTTRETLFLRVEH
jgi:hypothetical protein